MKRALGFMTVISLFQTSASLALIGEGLIALKSDSHPEVCYIQVTHTDRSESVCTGSLVSPTQIYTAGHCFGRDYNPWNEVTNVSCGGKNLGRTVNVSRPDEHNDDNWEVNPETNTERPVVAVDYAIINFSSPIRLDPISVASGPEKYFAANGDLLSNVSCSFYGYGNTDAFSHNYRNQILGYLIEAPINAQKIKLSYTKVGFIVTTAVGGGALSTSVNGGDSGGPLQCQVAGQSPELVGIIINYSRLIPPKDQLRRTNVMNPAWKMNL